MKAFVMVCVCGWTLGACATDRPVTLADPDSTAKSTTYAHAPDVLAAAMQWVAHPTQAPEFMSIWAQTEVRRLVKEGSVFKVVVGQSNISEAHQAVLLTLSWVDGTWKVTEVAEVSSTHFQPSF